MKNVLSYCGIGLLLAFAPIASIGAQLSDLEGNMRQAEAWILKVQSSGVIEEFSPFDTALDRYADTAYALHKDATKQAQEYSKSGGKNGSLSPFTELEKVTSAHVTRAEGIVKGVGTIRGLVSTGKVTLSQAALRELPPAALQELRSEVDPVVLKKYNLTPLPAPKPAPKPASQSDTRSRMGTQHDGQQPSTFELVYSEVKRNVETVAGLFIPAAQAATGLGCTATCIASTGLACGACLLAGGVGLADEYGRWRECRKASQWTKVWCWTRFIAMIA